MRISFRGQPLDVPDNATEDQIKEILALHAATAPDSTAVRPTPAVSVAPAAPQPSMVEQGVQMLPEIGGALGGFVPGPLGIPAAGAGQALGELGRQAFSGPPGIENPMGIAKQGLQGAALGAAGGLAGKVVGGLAKGAYAIGGRVAPKVAKTLIKYGINVSEGGGVLDKVFGKQGMQRLTKVFGKQAQETKALYSAADAQVGKNISVRELTSGLRAQVGKVQSRSEKKFFVKAARKVEADYNKQLTPSAVRQAKQRYQNASSWGTEQAGSLERQASKLVAQDARKAIVSRPLGRHIANADAELGRLKDARRALRGATNRVPGVGESMRLGGTAVPGTNAGPLAALIDHPQLYSTLALLLNATKGGVNQGVRAAGNLAFPPPTPQQ